MVVKETAFDPTNMQASCTARLTEVNRMPATPSMAQRPCTSSACTILQFTKRAPESASLHPLRSGLCCWLVRISPDAHHFLVSGSSDRRRGSKPASRRHLTVYKPRADPGLHSFPPATLPGPAPDRRKAEGPKTACYQLLLCACCTLTEVASQPAQGQGKDGSQCSVPGPRCTHRTGTIGSSA